MMFELFDSTETDTFQVTVTLLPQLTNIVCITLIIEQGNGMYPEKVTLPFTNYEVSITHNIEFDQLIYKLKFDPSSDCPRIYDAQILLNINMFGDKETAQTKT